ncbi:MAG: glucose-1-phosphate thymidylyltransferase [bacterium]|nr:glucose-1-phosphate thymidylyltransferase [bacterium]
MLKPEDFFDLSNFEHKAIFDNIEYVWEVIPKIEDYIKQVIQQGGKPSKISGEIMDGAYLIGDDIVIGEGTVVEPGAYIKGPTIIGKNTQVRQGAYVRGSVLVGDNCVVGHTTEIKNAIMLNGAKAGHFAYIGDSILGQEVNLGAGTKLANFKFENLALTGQASTRQASTKQDSTGQASTRQASTRQASSITIRVNDRIYETGLRKLGGILGDRTETGCNSVTGPGTLLGPKCVVYPNTTIKGYYPANSVIKSTQGLEINIHKG